VWVITKRKYNSLPRGSVSYYQEQVWVNTKRKRKWELLQRENVTHYKEEVFSYYQEKM
jgi:hypothetical protein